MTDETDDVVILQVSQGFPELLLRYLLHSFVVLDSWNATLLPFLLNKIIQIAVLQSIGVNSLSKLSLNVLDKVADYIKLLGARLGLPGCDDIHVDFTSGWISC